LNTFPTHRAALLMMFAATGMWSIAGFITRKLHHAQGFEITFWRSVFTVLSLCIVWPLLLKVTGQLEGQTEPVGRRILKAFSAGPVLWVSGLCWAAMFTCFMIALATTTVANVLVAQSVGPLFTALLTWLWLKRPVGLNTWLVIAAATVGIVVMFVFDTQALAGKHWVGFVIGLGIPTAAAINWNAVERYGKGVDFIAALFLGAVISSLAMLPFAMPFKADTHDLRLLALLGLVQLAIPCAICVLAAKRLRAAEISLLALLEVVFGIVLAVLFTSERPSLSTWIGGAIVVLAIAANEVNNLRRKG
jgi:drug/metabolite transporter (DMT)-like permease